MDYGEEGIEVRDVEREEESSVIEGCKPSCRRYTVLMEPHIWRFGEVDRGWFCITSTPLY